ncbi:MAG: MobF family relaxase [Planctomycetaceae bacterium]
MLRINESKSASQAKWYYTQGLSAEGEYYSRDQAQQDVEAQWHGQTAHRMGLQGVVDQEDFYALADHRNPQTDEPLTPRKSDQRRVGYDFTFDVPKSVSVYWARTRDERVVQLFHEAVQETMAEIETSMQTRVRRNGESRDRTTGNMVWASFTHYTARPVDGQIDPQLHQHNFVFNATWDEKEQRYKAGQFGDLKRNAPYFQAAANARLAGKLRQHGFQTVRTEHGFELAGFTDGMKDVFSRRTQQIEQQAASLGIHHAEDKAQLGAKGRERKRDDVSLAELKQDWDSRLTDREWKAFLSQASGGGGEAVKPVTERQAVEHALAHKFAGQSVASERDVLKPALEFGIGSVSVEGLKAELAAHADVLSVTTEDRTLLTTRRVLAEERRMVEFAREGRGTVTPLVENSLTLRPPADDPAFSWKPDQKAALQHALSSTDRVVAIRGAAGTGKSTVLAEYIHQLESHGLTAVAVAPSTTARDELKLLGVDAHTVAKFVQSDELQSQLQQKVLIVDEAGRWRHAQHVTLFDVARERECPGAAGGRRSSTRQSVALQLVQQAGIRPAEITHITRQKPRDYREAVELLSHGTPTQTQEGFDRLNAMGVVHEVEDDERYQLLADSILGSQPARRSRAANAKKVLVVSPTHAEADRTTGVIGTLPGSPGIWMTQKRRCCG